MSEYPNAEMTAEMRAIIVDMGNAYDVYYQTDDTLDLTKRTAQVTIAVFPEKAPLVVDRAGFREPKGYTGYCRADATIENGDIIVLSSVRYRVSEIELWGSFKALTLEQTNIGV